MGEAVLLGHDHDKAPDARTGVEAPERLPAWQTDSNVLRTCRLCILTLTTGALRRRYTMTISQRLLGGAAAATALAVHLGAQTPMTSPDSARHTLNRVAYGATP